MLLVKVRFKTSLQNGRIIVEVMLLLSALVLSESIGFGTFVIIITFGPVL